MATESESKSADSASQTPSKPTRVKAKSASRKGGKKPNRKKASTKPDGESATKKRVDRPYPRVELQEAIKVPMAIRKKNGGNPWPPSEVAKVLEQSKSSSTFYYLTAASRDFGLTEGTRDTAEISLTELGRRLAYAETPQQEQQTRRDAFFKVELFRQVLDYYKGSTLPEMKFLQNTLESRFNLNPSVHEEFAEVFRKNCEYLGIKEGGAQQAAGKNATAQKADTSSVTPNQDIVTVAEPEDDTGLVCFVAMPFSERSDEHVEGFFTEVLNQIIAPAGRKAGFRVITARKQGSDVIQSTIVNGLLDADLVVVDLTEHNPNVLFELGMRLAEDKPVALVRAAGTKPIFDVDNVIRVEEYSPSLWRSTVETDMPKISDHIKASWETRDSSQTYMKILRAKAK